MLEAPCDRVFTNVRRVDHQQFYLKVTMLNKSSRRAGGTIKTKTKSIHTNTLPRITMIGINRFKAFSQFF